MAQTTDAQSFINVIFQFKVEDDEGYTDASGHLTSLEVGGEETGVGETFTGASNKPILTFGKDSPVEITAKSVHTENPGEIFVKLRAAKKAHKKVQFKWQLKSGGTTYETDPGIISSCPPPAGESESEDAILTEITAKFPGFTDD